jgi:glycosyltransferase involved in cell wall biosynthesis
MAATAIAARQWGSTETKRAMLNYAIIVPVRDEQEHIGRMLDSVLAQRQLPVSVHVIDDGSSDGTSALLALYQQRSPLIRVTTLPRSGSRREGGEAAVQAAFPTVDWGTTDILARLDGDISFGPDFFQIMLSRFEEDARLGIASGIIYEHEHGEWVAKSCPTYHTRGACKLYRRECYHEIKPIATCLGWDGQDEARANCYGWKTHAYSEAKIYHHRPIGSLAGRVRFARNLGISAYYIGYHPVFMIARAFRALTRRPLLIRSLFMLVGMVEGYLKKLPREPRKEVVSYLRKQQVRRLFGLDSAWRLVFFSLQILDSADDLELPSPWA